MEGGTEIPKCMKLFLNTLKMKFTLFQRMDNPMRGPLGGWLAGVAAVGAIAHAHSVARNKKKVRAGDADAAAPASCCKQASSSTPTAKTANPEKTENSAYKSCLTFYVNGLHFSPQPFVTLLTLPFFFWICALLEGVKVVEHHVDPYSTLLEYVRDKLGLTGTKLGCGEGGCELGLTGTKLGCGEGGCGACTVVIGSYNAITDTVSHKSVHHRRSLLMLAFLKTRTPSK